MTKELLVLKFSSELIACSTVSGSYAIDYLNIRRYGHEVSSLLECQGNLSLIVVTSAARKLLGKDAWHEVLRVWNSSISRDVKGFQISDNDFDDKSVRAIGHAANGGVSIVNGNDRLLSENSRWRNNDHVSASLIGKAVTMGMFGAIELGMFTNVNGLLGDIHDKESVLPVVHDIEKARALVVDSDKPGTTGGMSTKLDAANDALMHGAYKTWIAHGRASQAIELARKGLIGTTFLRERS